jgi:YVTN family beta-propeller protein
MVVAMKNPLRSIALVACGLMLSAAADQAIAQTAETGLLQLETKIPLGTVRGRIDHMAIDLARQHLFVAELGNNSVAIVDLTTHKVIRTIGGLKEPQGVAFVPSTGALYVANAGDGSLRVFAGPDYSALGRIDLGDDADNIRLDSAANRLFVGYGSGGLAVIDTVSFKKVADIPLSVHPEGFQLDATSNQVFVNLPKAKAIVAVDRQSGKQTAMWPTGVAGANFPMALEQSAGHVLAAFRNPPKLGVFSSKDGALIASPDICGDADDVFIDAKRHRVYISCGDGFLDVLNSEGGAYRRAARVPTASGARTSLFVPDLDRLLLAVRAASGEPAAIWVFRPSP